MSQAPRRINTQRSLNRPTEQRPTEAPASRPAPLQGQPDFFEEPAEGNFQTLYGQSVQPLNPEPFVEALVRGEQRVAVGIDSAGNEVALFGVGITTYPMQDGSMSTGLVAAVPLEYIINFLSLEDEEQLMYYHIIRPDGSFVIQSPHTELGDFFKRLQM